MENIDSSSDTRLSVEKIVDLVRQVRNDLIKDFLQEDNLRTYFTSLYNREITPVKMEFLKRDLKELLISPVDLIHYASLIKFIRESNTATISKENQESFYAEIEGIFRKYNF